MTEAKPSGAGKRVCVTGASGYVGSHIVRELLERGYDVRGTVRDPGDADKTKHLHALATEAPGSLELVSADLMQRGTFDKAFEDCELIVHSASSVRLTAKDPQRDIVDVAVQGTTNVLDSIENVGGVRRVVLTSSISAVVDESLPHDYRFSEDDWNESATLEASPYPLSKTLAERAAWKRAEGKFELVTLSPTLVLGPLYTRAHYRSSPAVVRDLLRGAFPFIPSFHFGVVDVRDVAVAHAEALERPDAQGRHILNNRGVWMREIADVLAAAHPDRKTPRRTVPDALWYLFSLFDKRLTWSFLRANLSVARRIDNRKSVDALGITYRPIEASLHDTARSLIDGGWL